MGRFTTLVVGLVLLAAACAPGVEPTSTVEASSTTIELPVASTQPPASTTTSTSATTTTTLPEDPWEIETVDVEDWEGGEVPDAVAQILRADSLVEATIETLGNQQEGGRWCCENPPFTVTDVRVIEGSYGRRGTDLNGVEYQDLRKYIEPGDRVTLLLNSGIAYFVFDEDGGLVHPVPPHEAEAINILREREATWFGYGDGTEMSPLAAVQAVWSRYRDDWWGSIEQRTALALSGVSGYPDTCSAADMAPVLEMYPHPPSSDGLPDAVADTRVQLIEAATACDFESIIALTGEPQSTEEEPAYRDEFWWSATNSPEYFVENDRVYGALRKLAFALSLVGYGVTSLEQADGSTETYYSWPKDYGEVEEGETFADLAPFDELSRIAALNRMDVDDLVGYANEFGAYALFRTGIRDDGQWLYALSGD
ncbi:MAG: hypothetical protein ABFR89_04950 [Actinomycetota bacterium]